jgi:deoxycytidylate deaminase
VDGSIPIIERPELFLGFVAPIGADLDSSLRLFRQSFEAQDYDVQIVKVTNSFKWLAQFVVPDPPLVSTVSLTRYQSYISYGNRLREKFQDSAFLARIASARVLTKRNKLSGKYAGTVYLLHQFKRKEEIELLRAIYGRLFFQVSVYSRRTARIDHLSRMFAHAAGQSDINGFRASAEAIVQRDYDESEAGGNELRGHSTKHGQNVGKIFHDADFIVNMDIDNPSPKQQIERFCSLLFGSNAVSPSKLEYGMFAAKSAALRSLDLSRQVGAAVLTEAGEVLATGSNEVPRATGGAYWSDEPNDDREFRRGRDSNDQRKREILAEIAKIIDKEADIDELLKQEAVINSQFMDALEYGRTVHAEMSAICDGARLGRELKSSVLHTTTFPCHMCAKHIVAAGIKRVVFLEPYPKSLAYDLHTDSIDVEGGERGKYASFPAVHFEHFYGITPRRYRELFERLRKRKDDGGFFKEFKDGAPRPLVEVSFPFYADVEARVFKDLTKVFLKKLGTRKKLVVAED